MAANSYRGMTVRITRGTGAGQERTIAANNATTLTLSPAWVVEPDATSFFVVAEAGWHFGALTKSSPVQFAVPNRAGEMVEITGRAANVNDVECAPELSTVTRWQIGGAGVATIATCRRRRSSGCGAGKAAGRWSLSGVSFTNLTNTRTISVGTLTLYYWDELQGHAGDHCWRALLAASDTDADSERGGTGAGGKHVSDRQRSDAGDRGHEQRDAVRSDARHAWHTAAAHAAQAPVYHLASKTVIAPFPDRFLRQPL